MAKPPTPSVVLGKLADERRLRAFAAVALGEGRMTEIAERAGLSEEDAARALAQLVSASIVVQGSSGLEVNQGVFAEAARAASSPRRKPDLSDATPEQAAVLRNFVDADGRVAALPAREAKRRLVLAYVATRLESGREYAEREVNDLLSDVSDDYVTLRRCLVDEGLLERDAGVYRRSDLVTV